MLNTIIFGCNCVGWSKDVTLNEAFLRVQEDYIKMMFVHYGYRYLNQIYEVYGAPWDPREYDNTCYLKENGELKFKYHLNDDGDVVIDIWQDREGI